MGVSWCFLKWWYPQIIHFNRDFHYKSSILGCFPIFGNTHIPNPPIGSVIFQRQVGGSRQTYFGSHAEPWMRPEGVWWRLKVVVKTGVVNLPETNISPENLTPGSLEIPNLETIIFGGELLVSGSVFVIYFVYPHTIHETGIFNYVNGWVLNGIHMVNVGKYTSPMDGLGTWMSQEVRINGDWINGWVVTYL